jgi:hypothetical protein
MITEYFDKSVRKVSANEDKIVNPVAESAVLLDV